MAVEMSCLPGLDEDDKDADPEINALVLLQEPVGMAQDSVDSMSCTNSLGKPSLKQNNNVLGVLSNSDMFCAVGLGNGPSSHQITKAHDHNSVFTDKEEEKNITQLKTVQEIDTAGIWDFEESPENSLDHFGSANDNHWDPHRDFMHFLWENHGDSPGEEPKEESTPPRMLGRRKRKMDMVVKVDPTEDLYPGLSCKSSEDLSDAEDQVDSVAPRKVQKSRNLLRSHSAVSGKVSDYPNGTVTAIKQILYSPTRNSVENRLGHQLSPLKGRLSMNSSSKEKPSSYPCPKCKLIYKKEHHLQRHLKSHVDSPNKSPKPFICRECGQSFKQGSVLIQHMSIHQNKTARLIDEIRGMNDLTDVDENATLFCPQCSFGTNCPNKFVQHAKTHEKDKRVYHCNKCSFNTACVNGLKRHEAMQHTVSTRKTQKDVTGVFDCNICSYRAFSINVFKKHLLRRHQQSYEEYRAAQESEQNTQQNGEKHVLACNPSVEDTEFMSKISIKNQISSREATKPCDSNDISDLFKYCKRNQTLKSQERESKLDKSINVLLSRQRHERRDAELKKNCSTDEGPNNCTNQSPETPTIKAEEAASRGKCTSERDPQRNHKPQLVVDPPTLKRSPSKRKMSTPFRNTTDQDSCFILPKPLPNTKKSTDEELEDEDEKNIFQLMDANANIFDQHDKQNLMYTYSRRMSMRGALQASKRLFDKVKTEEEEQDIPVIKEECMETEIFRETFDHQPMELRESLTDSSVLEPDQKSCPYCPAVFESGVGLSNHVRGHLHRVGLSYNARHVVSPEQVASQDRRPRIRRRISAIRRLKKAFQLQSDSTAVKNTHSCPLCGDSFDNRTGQSNHIRGHLKRLGKTFSTKNKSPLFLLRELMRDKKEFHRALQILGKNLNHCHDGASPTRSSGDDFAPSPIGIPKVNTIPRTCDDTEPLTQLFPLDEMEYEKKPIETKYEVKGSLSGSTALIGILKKRKCQEECKMKGFAQISRNAFPCSSNSEHTTGSGLASSLLNPVSETGEFNRKVCVHCNATFHSGVSLSNHLRAYAKRKRTALLEGTTYDCKVRRQRSRPGSKKKTLPIPQTPEEMYRLTCRFCDLVFQGPLSVQEDWIKHLQRHIMNTSVPHTGLSMVEVSLLPKDLPTQKTDQESSSMATQAAS